MLRRLAFASIVACVAAASAEAQDRTTDSRLYPYLGCWRSDAPGAAGQADGLTCVVPVGTTQGVDIISVIDGKVVSRRRVEADTRPHSIDGQGCRGEEKTSWSPRGRRVYLRAEYMCTTGVVGGTMTLFSLLPSGEWLEVEHVRSGSGSIVRIERRTDAGMPGNLPREIAGRISTQRLAIVTARADAAAPLRTDDIVETLRHTDSAVARAWLLETGQPFQLSGDQFSSLTRAEVPAPVLQAAMSAPPRYQLGVGVDANGRSTDEYLSTPGWSGGYASQAYVAQADYSGYSGGIAPYGASSGPCCYPPVFFASYNNFSAAPQQTNYQNAAPDGYSAYNPFGFGGFSSPIFTFPSTFGQRGRPFIHNNPFGFRPGQGHGTPKPGGRRR